MRPRILFISTLIAAALTATACGSSNPAPQVLPTAPAASALIQPVPGTNSNVYNVGPFTVSLLQGVALESDGRTYGSEVLVENTSNDSTAFANPEIKYTLDGEVIGTCSGTTTSLAPGEKQHLWIPVQSDRDIHNQYVDAQLISVLYGRDPSKPGTRLQLAR
jgi:hypothetical protein